MKCKELPIRTITSITFPLLNEKPFSFEPTFDKQTKWLDSIDCCRSMSFSRIQEGFVGQRSGQPVVRAG